MDINIPFILMFLFNILITVALFVLAIVYFFSEARQTTKDTHKRSLLISGFISVVGIIVALFTRFLILFPQVDGYDMNSNFSFVVSVLTVSISFFVLVLYIRCGEHFTREKGLPGSIFLKRRKFWGEMDWKAVLLPLPFLILWTFVWFALFTPEPTKLMEAATPMDDSLITYIYLFLSISILAPLQEEILYRHFVMGLLYKWMGRKKVAVIFNIMISAVIFSFAHIAILTDDWVKILQIVPAGMFFGWLYHKRGLEHCVVAHALFNTLVIPISMLLEMFA